MKHQILIVDDDALVLRTVKRILETNGITVITADSGEACIDRVREGFRGLVLMDVSMPGMDGWETIRSLKEKDLINGLVISMLTAREIPDPDMNYLKEHVLDYITKPFNTSEFVKIIKGHLADLF